MTKTQFTIEPATQEVQSTRIFNAPRAVVFKAFTDPKHIPNWWGPRQYQTRVDQMEVKPGGQWRFIQEANGHEFGFHGVYHSVNAPEQTVSTFEFEGMPGHVLLETAQFEALPDGTTRLTVTSVFQSIQDRDGMVASGMEAGNAESYDRFEELLKTL